ncbi:MAG: hypothetical protein L0312_05660 [Acidobacteria bacterium]|nr:hypothetical protein [Acidobacteriota bacterium]
MPKHDKRERSDLINKALSDEPGQPTKMQRHQAFLDHIAARGQHAIEYKKKHGTLKGSGYTEADIQKFKDVFGVDP